MNKTFFYHALSALFVGGMAFSAVSCADDDLAEKTNNGDTEAAVRFDVSDSQEDAQTRGALTRGAITPGLTDKDLDGKKLAVQSSENLDVCLIETTVEGVNPVKLEPGTRANITTLEKLTDFSSTGVRGTAANAINKEWFNEERIMVYSIIQDLGLGFSLTAVSMLSIQKAQTAVMVLSSANQTEQLRQALSLR